MKTIAEANRWADEIALRLDGLAERSTARMRSIRREYSKSLSRATPDLVIQVAIKLASRPGAGLRFVAYEIVARHKSAFESLTIEQLSELAERLNSWDAVDCFGCILAGPAWRDGRLPDLLIREWAKSEDRWWRRAALVSTVALSRRGGRADVARTLEICRLLAADSDDMVTKALSWALREVAKKHSQAARKFLDEHGDSLAARVRREVSHKITAGVKNPRREFGA
jgi:3-methyladenine DNA glycosylase AlkD